MLIIVFSSYSSKVFKILPKEILHFDTSFYLNIQSISSKTKILSFIFETASIKLISSNPVLKFATHKSISKYEAIANIREVLPVGLPLKDNFFL